MEILKNKRCPRCDKKQPKTSAVCPFCMLNFQKFESATNKEAKQALKQGENDRVLMRKGVPQDVNKFVLFLITLFAGFTGAHYYFVGRNKMGLFFTCFFIVGLVNAGLQFFVLPKNTLFEILTFLTLVWGAVLLIWIVDIFKVCFNKFKIPVSRDY